ncbi:MAG: hypothetical protein HY278_02050 [candidate division NC10 bacterium]|nr:hypothetical protein [candidate division NC10 bacterium]
MPDITVRSLKFAIMEALASTRKSHKFNLIGRASLQGDLERRLRTVFEPAHREMADIAFQELKSASLIRSTYDDLIDPDSWVEITEAGRIALARRSLDALDEALAKISPTLVELRDGAWSAVASGRPDSLRQASHSARELIDQTLKEGVPDGAVRHMPGFIDDPNSRTGITRRHRLRYLIGVHQDAVSESDLKVAEEACDLVLAADARLTALAHSRTAPTVSDVKDSLQAAEIALRRLLLRE